jgi:hypothetical protein
MPSQEKYRQASYEYMRDRRIARRIHRHLLAKTDPSKRVLPNGHVITTRVCIAMCQNPGCGTAHEFTMTTRPHLFCRPCKAAREKARDRGRKR